MQQEHVIQLVERWLVAKGYKYDCIEWCEPLSEEWISNMMSLGVFSDRKRPCVWEAWVRYERPSPTSCSSPNSVSMFVDDESGEIQEYLHL